MKQSHRFVYYFSGFAIGIVFLIFFFSGKETSCAYGPDARTLKSIRVKKHVYSEQTKRFFVQHQLDSSAVSHILKTGDVDFGKSLTQKDPCNVYFVYGDYGNLPLEMTIERCDSIATVQNIALIEK